LVVFGVGSLLFYLLVRVKETPIHEIRLPVRDA
jgi:hypothetical protein